MTAVAILNTGMVTGVGMNTESSCAALRVGITAFRETRFMFDGDWIEGSEVRDIGPFQGREKLIRMLGIALEECLLGLDVKRCRDTALVLCLAEAGRPGRSRGADGNLLEDIQTQLGVRLHPSSTLICEGRVGGIKALDEARRILQTGCRFCLVAGVDSLLVRRSLEHYHQQRRLLTADNSDGFVPGEAAAAILLGEPDSEGEFVTCCGIGYGTEPSALDQDVPLRAEGLTSAFRMAVADSGRTFEQIHYRVADHNGEQFGFKEAAMALTRTVRPVKSFFDVWHPSDCIGEVGAAFVPCALAWIATAARKGYAPGPGALCHAGGDSGERAAIVLAVDQRRRS